MLLSNRSAVAWILAERHEASQPGCAMDMWRRSPRCSRKSNHELSARSAVPVSAVDSRGTNPVVHRLRDGRVVEIPVQLGMRDEVTEMVEIRSGLTPGDTVLLGSAQGVAPGARVRVLQEEAQR